ncbi:MAG: signal peptidase II [Granulosicoccaceae bacterium]
MRLWVLYGLSLLVVMLDQWSKQIAEAAMDLGEGFRVTSWFNWALAYNEGAAWSFLADEGGWQRWFFVVLSAVVSIALIIWIYRCWRNEAVLAFSLSLVLGGAVGNLIDRALYGHVIDFIQWHYNGWYFPTFNVADMAITAGAAIMIWCSFFLAEPTAKSTHD